MLQKDIFKYNPLAIKESLWLMLWRFRAIWLKTNWQRDISMSKCLINAAMTLSFLSNQWFFGVFCTLFLGWPNCLPNASFIFSSFWKNLILLEVTGDKESSWLMPWKFLAFLKTIWQRDFSISKCLIDAAMTNNSQWVFVFLLWSNVAKRHF